MKVLVFLPHPGPRGHIGGALFRTIDVIKKGKEHGIEYVIVENSPSFNKHFSMGCESHVIGIRNIVSSPYSFMKTVMDFSSTAARRAKKGDIDLILSPLESPVSIMASYFSSKLSKVPWTTILHSVPGYWYISGNKSGKTSRLLDIYRHQKHHRYYGGTVLFGALTRWLSYKFLKKTTSLTVSKSLNENLKFVEPAMDVIDIYPGNGIDYERIRKARKKGTYDAVFAGAIIPEKGIYDVVDAWETVVKERPDAKLCMLGRGSKENVDKLLSRIKNLGLEKNIVMPFDLTKGADTNEEIWSHLKGGKVFIYPSIVDAWPLMVGEALACALPVIAYDIPPIKYSYGNCSSMFTVQRGNIDLMANQALKLLSSPSIPSLKKKAAMYAREHGWDRVLDAEKRSYLRLLRL